MRIQIFFILSLICGAGAWASEFEVIPLNSAAAQSLKKSPLSKNVVAADSSKEIFHQKTLAAAKQMANLIDTKKIDSLSFIYDSHFLNENAFLNKYSSVPKPQLIKARKIASEVYSR